VHVSLDRNNDSFQFQIKNSKDNHPATERHGGIGLQNVKRRLELLYPGKHELHITETAADFQVQLQIQLA
jgi:LytS/YehU family sensor histidine kinase